MMLTRSNARPLAPSSWQANSPPPEGCSSTQTEFEGPCRRPSPPATWSVHRDLKDSTFFAADLGLLRRSLGPARSWIRLLICHGWKEAFKPLLHGMASAVGKDDDRSRGPARATEGAYIRGNTVCPP